MKISRLAPAWLLVNAIGGGFVPAAAGVEACEPSKAVQAVLKRAGELATRCGRSKECWRQRRDLLAAELVKRPRDFFLHRAYLELFESAVGEAAKAEQGQLGERYRALASRHPGDARYLYLRGQLARDQRPEARQLFAAALQLDPTFPWPRLGLALVPAPDGVAMPVGEAAGHLAAFERACPSRQEEVLLAVAQLKGERRLEPVVAAVRKSLAKRRDREVLSLYSWLWQSDFQVQGEADLEPARQRVAADLAALENLGWDNEVSYWHLLIAGRELARDPSGAAVARNELVRRFPCDGDSATLRVELHDDKVPKPGEGAPEEERQAWAWALYTQSQAWTEECPQQALYRLQRFHSALELAELPGVAGLAEIDGMLSFLAGSKVHLSGGFVQSKAAQYLVERKIELARALALVDEVREKAEESYQERIASAELSAEMRGQFEISHAFELWEADKIEMRAHLAAGAVEPARALLQRMAATLGPEPGQGDEQGRLLYGNRQVDLALLEAERLAANGELLDALAFYQRAFAVRRQLGGKPKPAEIAAARALWVRLGGSAAGWAALSAEAGANLPAGNSALRWTQLEKP